MSEANLPSDLLPELERVEQIIAERTAGRSVVSGIASRHLGDGQGRLRAAVVLLAARLGERDAERTAHAAASVSLIYAACRVHDELVDEGDRRRGTVGEQPRWGGSATLMVGDYLLALAAAEMALAPDPRIISYYSRSVMAICEGQMAPITAAAPLEQARERYLYRAECISAALLESAAAAGGVCAALPQDAIASLSGFGRSLGLALHLAEDARDYEGAGRSLRAGTITLPLIYAVDAGAAHLLERLDQPWDDAAVRAALAEARRLGAVERALSDARAYAHQAGAHLDALPDGPALQALRALAAAAA